MSTLNKTADNEKVILTKLAEATLSIMDELVALMSREIDLINERKYDEHNELLKRKQRLTMDYRANMKTIAAQAELLKQLPESLRSKLKISARKLAEVSEGNSKFLRSAVMATQRLIQTIVSIVKQEVLPKTTYNNPATGAGDLGGYSPTCQPVAIDRTA